MFVKILFVFSVLFCHMNKLHFVSKRLGEKQQHNFHRNTEYSAKAVIYYRFIIKLEIWLTAYLYAY